MSVTVFALEDRTIEEKYDNDNAWVTAYCEISKYATSRYMEGDSIYPDTQASTRISVSYMYYDNSFEKQYGSDQDNTLAMSFVGKTFTTGSIYHMVYAYYDFWAQVPTSYGSQDFEANSIYLLYEA